MEAKMCKRTGRRSLPADQCGAVSIWAAVGMFALLGLTALAVDIAHMVMVKSELQKAADAGALAGARGLWPQALPVVANPPANPDCTTALTWARTTLGHNPVNGAALAAGEIDIQVGRWDYAARYFTPGCTATSNAVQVTTRKNGLAMIFARVLGITSANLTASATVVMDFARAVGKGTLPIAINKQFVIPGNTITINFTPDPLDNGGWFADPPDGANARTFRDYIINDSCPPLQVGDIINVQNGQDASVLMTLLAELALHPGGWNVFLPVVDTEQFNQSEPIVAFVPFKITQVDHQDGVTGTVLGMGEASTALPGGNVSCGTLAPPKAVN